MKRVKVGVAFLSGVLALLAACGSDSGTDSGFARAETVYGLGECEESNEGVVKLVTLDSTYYKCEDGYWESFSGPAVTGSSSSSRSTPKSSDSESYDDPWLDDDEVGFSDSESGDGDDDSCSSRVSDDSADSTYDVVTGTLTDSRDGQTYRTVKIGCQVWMAENLNYAYTGVPFNNSYYISDSTSWCIDNDPANCAKYGRRYTWAAAMDSVGEWSTSGKGCGHGQPIPKCSVASAGSATLVRGICPKGWHLPSRDEWETLIVTVDGSITEYTSSNTAGIKLKSATGWEGDYCDYKGCNGTDAFGFSALPAGVRYNDGYYGKEGSGAYFWSSTEENIFAYFMSLDYNYVYAYLYYYDKYNGFSVRCLKD